MRRVTEPLQPGRTVAYIDTTGEFVGGAEFSLLDLVTHLDQDRYRPLVVLPNWGGFAEELVRRQVLVLNLDGAGFPPLSFRIKGLKVYNPYAFVQYALELRALREKLLNVFRQRDVTLVHGNSFAGTLFGALAAHRAQLPFIAHLRELPPKGRWSGAAFRSLIRNVAMKNSAACIAISRAVAQAYAPDDGQIHSPITIMHDPIDTERFAPVSPEETIWRRREHGIPERAFVVGQVGRFEDWKGHLACLAAIDIVRRTSSRQVYLVFVGDPAGGTPSYMNEIDQRIVELGLAETVIMLGFQKDMPGVYGMLDAVVVPSDAEPLGRVVLEAMAMEKPVVATSIGGPAEIITDKVDGFLIRPRAANALASRIIELIHHPQLGCTMGAAAREKILNQYSITAYTTKVMELYDQSLHKDDCWGSSQMVAQRRRMRQARQ